MSTLNVNVNTVSVLKVGYAGENDATTVVFDFSQWKSDYGSGALMLYVQRPTDVEPYPVALSISGNKATWVVSDVDASYTGRGHIQLVYSVNNVIKKSRIIRFIVLNSVGPASEDTPNAYQNWLDQLSTIALDAHSAAIAADQSADDAEETARSLMGQIQRLDDVENSVADMDNTVDSLVVQTENISLSLLDLVNGGYVENGVAYFTHDDIVLFEITGIGGGGGGGGGGGNVVASLTVNNTTGWLSKTIAKGSACPISFTWSSIEDDMPTGNGTVRVTVNGTVRHTREIQQGSVSLDLSSYLSAGSNTAKVQIVDTYGTSRTINFNVTVIVLSISSTFDSSIVYSNAITFPYTPVGAVAKTVHFILDGVEAGTQETSVSGRQSTYLIPRQSHGAHTLRVYFDATINDETVRSNELYYEFIAVGSGNNNVIIASSFGETSVDQFTSIVFPYMVYDPAALTSEVTLSVSWDNEAYTDLTIITVDRTEQAYAYRANRYGALRFRIKSGNATKVISLTVTELEIDINAETDDLVLYLSSQGRSNQEAEPAVWSYKDISAQFSGFNWVSDGWQSDSDGISVMRVTGDARITIPYQPFATDFRGTGKTIELEFATRDVLNYDASIISCMSDDRGIDVTAQRVVLKSELSEIGTQYKEDEHVRIAFVAEKRAENRLLFVYINGIASGVIQYPENDDFSQLNPVNISIGSNGCTTDIYCIRIYDNDLSRFQIVDNWIADTQDGGLMVDRYTRNNIFDAYGNIVISNLPSDLPYFVQSAPELPQYKGDKKTVTGSYVDPLNPSKSFTYTGASSNVQGTSSQYYPRKNYKISFKGGFLMDSGSTAKTYAINDNAVPTDAFCFKADVASSEGANNVELARLYNDACPYKTPAQTANPKVRQGIDGFPIVMFWNDGENTSFLGKYNFNNDKGTEEVFGFEEPDESWEIKNNTGLRVLWKSDDYSDSGWLNDFEARYPDTDPAYEDPAQLAEFASWVKSTDTTQTTNSNLASSVTYDGTTYTKDTAAYRLAKFKAEAGNYMEMQSTLFYYLFTELFLMVDSRAKNAFPSFIGSEVK